MSKKDVLIRNIDDYVYRQAKAVAATKGITMGNAVGEALGKWVKESGTSELVTEVDANIKFVRSNWNKYFKAIKGKIAIVSGGRLVGVFGTFEEARKVASKSTVALVFKVDKPPEEREIELEV
jgi:hypothetical protein